MRFALPLVLAQYGPTQGQGTGTLLVELALVVLVFAGKPLRWIVLYIIPVVKLRRGDPGVHRAGKAIRERRRLRARPRLPAVIFGPILGFGDATYGGAPAAAASFAMR